MSEKPQQHRMNSTNLYVTTTQIILTSDPKNLESWKDLYRLIPYLRNSLCCVVCSALLVDPLSPNQANCYHHLCRKCRSGKKRLKPQCENCKDCVDYTPNPRLRILMQMYKKMCLSLINSQIFHCIRQHATKPQPGFERGAGNLILLIKEGAAFEDDYESMGGLPKSTYSILPCIYTNSATAAAVTAPAQSVTSAAAKPPQSLYSVLYPGSGNKITIKRKPKQESTNLPPKERNNDNNNKAFKKPCPKPKKGCRCGLATATPGKLTCCGQRCPCYVESKPCTGCKCRGCRNPHRPDGNKVPFMPKLTSDIVMPSMIEQPIQILHPQPQPMAAQLPLTQPPLPQPILENEIKLESVHHHHHHHHQPLDPQYFSGEQINGQFRAYKLPVNSVVRPMSWNIF